MKINYQKELDLILGELEKKNIQQSSDYERPTLLLHSCCAPCSSYVLEYLHSYFKITIFFYNPNITDKSEYDKRLQEVRRLVADMGLHEVDVIEGEHDPKGFFAMAAKWPGEREGGRRCYDCYGMRLFETARLAAEGGFDYFTSTLSISPHKNAQWLNELAGEAGVHYGVKALPSDFKKKNGYKRSIELSAEYGLYRQDYCGCIFSKKERELQ